MDHGLHRVGGEHGVQGRAVPDVHLVEGEVLAGDGADGVQRLGLGIDKVVHDHELVARVQQLHAGVAADVPGPAGDKNLHGEPP